MNQTGPKTKIFVQAFGKELSITKWTEEPEFKESGQTRQALYARVREYNHGEGIFETLEEIISTPLISTHKYGNKRDPNRRILDVPGTLSNEELGARIIAMCERWRV